MKRNETARGFHYDRRDDDRLREPSDDGLVARDAVSGSVRREDAGRSDVHGSHEATGSVVGDAPRLEASAGRVDQRNLSALRLSQPDSLTAANVAQRFHELLLDEMGVERDA